MPDGTAETETGAVIVIVAAAEKEKPADSDAGDSDWDEDRSCDAMDRVMVTDFEVVAPRVAESVEV